MSKITDSSAGRTTWAAVLDRGALGDAAADVSEELERPTGPDIRYAELELGLILPNSRQPRSVFDEEALRELASSMALIGLLQPVVVRPLPEPVDGQPRAVGVPAYELVAGERRYRCAQQLGWATIPAVVRRTQDGELLRDALLENVHRAALNPLEEAAAYQQLQTDFACTQEELARRVGRSRPQIANTIRLLKLPPSVQRRVAAGILSQGHARALLSLTDEEAIESLASRIVAEGLSVRRVEEIVAVGERPERAHVRRRRSVVPDEHLDSVAEELGDHLDTRVQVSMGQTKGRVTIEFAGREDLARIVDIVTGGRSQT